MFASLNEWLLHLLLYIPVQAEALCVRYSVAKYDADMLWLIGWSFRVFRVLFASLCLKAMDSKQSSFGQFEKHMM